MSRLKPIFSLLIIVGLFYCNNFAYASLQQQSTEKEDPIVLKKGLKDLPKNRPGTPEFNNQFVTCSYSDGVITLTFTEPEGICRGSISDVTNGKLQLITFDSSELTVEIEIGTLKDFNIEFSTQIGNTYVDSTSFC